jgi:transcriptional regulator with XRE-family HTH domain
MITFGKQIADARGRYGLSQMKIARLVGRSQWWLSAVERGKVPITESVANKILLAVHKAGQRTQVMVFAPADLKDLRIGPRSNAKTFKNLKNFLEGDKRVFTLNKMRIVGSIVHFSRRGFALISAAETQQDDRGQLFFAHVRDIAQRPDLPVGARVSFEVAPPTPEHPSRAIEVRLIEIDSAVPR